MYQYKLKKLKNGLRLITVPMPQVESVTVMIGVGAGSRNEKSQVNGLFHFIEHMAFKGTKKRPRPLQIATEVDGVGGHFSAFTDKEATCYFIKLAHKHTSLAFDILSDMLTNSLFDKREIEKEKGVIIEEINMFEDIPMRRVQEVFIRLLYGDNSMGWDIGGEKEVISKIKKDDFLDYLNRLYFPQNMVVVVAGRLDEEKVEKLTEKYLEGLKNKGQKITETIKPYQEKPRVKLVTKETEQAHFSLGVPGYSCSDKNRFALGVLASVLGGGMSSRLFEEIRDKRGLAYYVFAQPEFHTDSGYLFAQGGIRLNGIDEAIKVVLAQYQELVSKKVSQKELSKAKEYLKGGMILALEDSQQVAIRYTYQALLEKRIRTPDEALKLIDKVTAEDVRKVARELFVAKNLNLAIIGPYKEENRFRKLLEA